MNIAKNSEVAMLAYLKVLCRFCMKALRVKF